MYIIFEVHGWAVSNNSPLYAKMYVWRWQCIFLKIDFWILRLNEQFQKESHFPERIASFLKFKIDETEIFGQENGTYILIVTLKRLQFFELCPVRSVGG